VSTLHQPCVGDEVTDSWEAVDVVYFVEDHQGEDLCVKGVHECAVHLNGGTDHGVGESVFYTGAIRAAVYALFERGQVVLSIGVLDVRLELCMLTRKVQPAAKEIPS